MQIDFKEFEERIDEILYKYRIILQHVNYITDRIGRITQIEVYFKYNDEKSINDKIEIAIQKEAIGHADFQKDYFDYNVEYDIDFYSESFDNERFEYHISNDEEYFTYTSEPEELDFKKEILKRKFLSIVEKVKDKEENEMYDNLDKAFEEIHKLVKEFLLELEDYYE